MSELEEAMEMHMAHLNFLVGRTFYYGDFMPFEVDGRQHNPSYGTVRNIFSEFKRQGKIKINCKSKQTFYELKESNLTKKSMTATHMGGISTVIHNTNPLYTKLRNLPMDKHSIHDIRLRLTVPDIYEAIAATIAAPIAISTNSAFPIKIRDNSGDIELPYWNVDNATIQIRIHKTNTVSVVLACSQEPFPLDFSGITAFFTTLGQVRGALVWTMVSRVNHLVVPRLSDWLITMWHFGRDSLIEVSGQRHHETVETAGHIIERFYTKDLDGKQKLRHEILEYPNKNPFEAIDEKLNLNPDSVNSPSQLPELGPKRDLHNGQFHKNL